MPRIKYGHGAQRGARWQRRAQATHLRHLLPQGMPRNYKGRQSLHEQRDARPPLRLQEVRAVQRYYVETGRDLNAELIVRQLGQPVRCGACSAVYTDLQSVRPGDCAMISTTGSAK